MTRRYVTVDVFTDRLFGGNPLAVVLDAGGLDAAQMQAIAREFNYSETTFVLPARDPAHTAQVRIFTAKVEVPFAGHPNVGTAVILAHEREAGGGAVTDHFLFEEAAGLVPIRLLRLDGTVVGAELTAPEPLSIRAGVSVDEAAACLTLDSREICVSTHPPQVLSIGLPFLVVEVSSREALRRSKPNLALHERVLPPAGTDAVLAYCHGARLEELHARVFSPIDGTIEDPATGSACAATIALLATLRSKDDEELEWRIEQGVDMGRASLLLGRTVKRDASLIAVRIGGHAIPVMRGTLPLD